MILQSRAREHEGEKPREAASSLTLLAAILKSLNPVVNIIEFDFYNVILRDYFTNTIRCVSFCWSVWSV